MNKRSRSWLWAFLLLLLIPALALAQAGGPYDLSWSSIDGGGHTFSAGGAYTLGGAIGQPDAAPASGGTFELQGGFWLCVAAAVTAADIAVGGGDITLTWSAGEPTTNIYRAANDPYFTPGAVYAGGVSSGWADTGAAGNPAHNYTYIVRARAAAASRPTASGWASSISPWFRAVDRRAVALSDIEQVIAALTPRPAMPKEHLVCLIHPSTPSPARSATPASTSPAACWPRAAR